MTDQVLSVEQMRELIKLGIDTSKAGACWYPDNDLDYPDNPIYTATFAENIGINYPGRIPTFTLQDILEMLPTHKTFSECNRTYNRCWVRLCSPENDNIHTELSNKSLLDASFKMLKWCKVNNCI